MASIIIGGLLQGSVFAIIALGFALVFRVTGVINLSQGAFCIVGAHAQLRDLLRAEGLAEKTDSGEWLRTLDSVLGEARPRDEPIPREATD